jgi:hypothetical protein
VPILGWGADTEIFSPSDSPFPTKRGPTIDYSPLRIVGFSGVALTKGIENHQIDGVSFRVTNIARTVADCFKFRNKLALDVAVEVLQQDICNHDVNDGVISLAKSVRATETCADANYSGA